MLAPRSVYHIGAMRFNETRCDNPPNRTGWGSFTLAYNANGRRASAIPQPGRLGILHSSLQAANAVAVPESPNRTGWGSFTLAYNANGRRASAIPQPGRLGILHSSLQPDDHSSSALQKRLHYRSSHFAACSSISRRLPDPIDPRSNKRCHVVSSQPVLAIVHQRECAGFDAYLWRQLYEQVHVVREDADFFQGETAFARNLQHVVH
jgi:hypothetical protein